MKYKTLLDPGHGGRACGAAVDVEYIKPVEYEEGEIEFEKIFIKLLEKDINLAAVKACSKHLLEYSPDIYPYYTRNDDVFVTLAERCAKAKEIEADSFISFHCNAYRDPTVSGFEVFHHFDEGKDLADIIHSWLKLSLPTHKDRGVKKGRYFVIREDINTGMPNGIKNSVLVEFEFMTNPTQAKWLSEESTQNLLGVIVSDALRDYYLC